MPNYSTVTSKGQITIPKKVRDTLILQAGDTVVFNLHDNMAIMSRANSVCPVCKGLKTINKKYNCMVCNGTGLLPNQSTINDLLQISRQYKVTCAVDTDTVLIPRIRLTSDTVPKSILNQYQDYYQMSVLTNYAPRSAVNPDQYLIPSQAILEEILTYFILEETKVTVQRMLSSLGGK